ncbi:regulatory protein RecX [Dinghuibacter silviterrae]|uniref:Regulatory protein RecX n=1 Tax=Dinghuibacter silviterrae TaxID=1539049 RepID=A0A4V3GLH7_9BACT|nr:regulatory protein RecX [Dinghuibacter silviterrae]TDW99572.1 regulatory protein [Dinghuibacter silviterrae]
MRPGRLSKEQALQKLRHYCAYQERCHQEAREKLFGFGLRGEEVDELISKLIEDNYLDEERFAVQFAGGKFRMKQWGRRKIEAELKARQVSTYCIRKGLAQIQADDYQKTLSRLAEDKYNALSTEEPFVARAKTMSYLLQKGYEPDLASAAIDNLAKP